MSEPQAVRVWDLPTRTFHWLLAVCVVGSVVSAKIGGGAMVWHFRFGYVVLTLLAFRLLWGFVGGHWSRFRAFVYAPRTSLRYLRGGSLPHEHHHVGHNPLGAWSVFGLLAVLVVQVATGLVADDEISNTGPLARFVSTATSLGATSWHRNYGQWIIIALVVLHIAAIAFYWFRRRQNLVAPMLHGDKLLTADVPASVDSTRSRVLALALLVACAGAVAWLVGLGG
ncbi:MAG TPA: cytochrome b/b6 domain-containing protein [Caldimonas sp.]|jgi:cytochrome b|nr:cytochrome b/b6 domain-containing protein [Caldimonas sp.]HEX2542505.1 cytochrome b/b6 domain-containing protein [Caldimonas sp.]